MGEDYYSAYIAYEEAFNKAQLNNISEATEQVMNRLYWNSKRKMKDLSDQVISNVRIASIISGLIIVTIILAILIFLFIRQRGKFREQEASDDLVTEGDITSENVN